MLVVSFGETHTTIFSHIGTYSGFVARSFIPDSKRIYLADFKFEVFSSSSSL